MKLFSKRIFGTLAILLATAPLTLLGQIDRSKAPEPGPAPIIELGESTVTVLPNGLTLIVVENHKIPKVSWSLNFDYSPIYEGSKSGMLDLFGELMRSGTTTKTKAELDEAIDFLGASLNASATSLSGTSLTKHSDKLLELMVDLLYNPAFTDSELNKLKTQSLSGLLAAETSPGEISNVLTRTLNYTHAHPYGEVTTAETLESLDREDFVNFYNRYFRPNIAYLVVVGDINPDDAYLMAEQYFGEWESRDVPYVRWEVPARAKFNRVCFSPIDGSVQTLIKVTHTINMSPGSEDAIAASVMNSILGGGAFSGRLMQNLREDKAFTYGARSSFNTDPYVGSFTAYADVRNEVTDSSVVEFLYEIKRMISEPVDSATLSLTKNFMTGSFARNLESSWTVASFAFNIEKYGLPKDYYSTYLEKLAAVTIEDIQRIAKQHLKPDQIYITCVGSRDVIPSLEKFSTSGTVELFDAYGKPLIERGDAAPGVTAESVITDYYISIGGVRALSKIKTLNKTGSIEIGGAMTLGYSQINCYKKGARGAHRSFSMSGQEIITNTITDDGGVEAQMSPLKSMEGSELLRNQWLSLSLTYLLDTEDYGISTELLGIENINGVEYHVVKFYRTDIHIDLTCYFELESKRLAMTKEATSTLEQDMTSTTNYNNYLDLGDGISFPMEVVSITGVQSMTIRIGNVEIDSEIDHTKFTLD
jgi:zinc protease